MTSPLVRRVLDAPEDIRLEVALDILRDLEGDGEQVTGAVCATFGVSRTPARMLALLLRRRGQPVSRGALAAFACMDPDIVPKVVDSHVCALRKKLRRCVRGSPIAAINGVGYCLDRQSAEVIDRLLADTTAAPPPDRRRWTEDQIERALEMRRAGLSNEKIACQLGRSCRAVKEKLLAAL